MPKHIQHNIDERTLFFRKIYLSLYWKSCVWERELETEQRLQHIDTHSSGYHSFSFLFSWAAQPGARKGGSLCWDMVPIPASSLQMTRTSCAPSYIIVLRPLNSNRRQSRLSPDILDRMHTGAFLILTAWPGRWSICNNVIQRELYKKLKLDHSTKWKMHINNLPKKMRRTKFSEILRYKLITKIRPEAQTKC